MMPCVVCSCSAYAQWRHCLSSDMWLGVYLAGVESKSTRNVDASNIGACFADRVHRQFHSTILFYLQFDALNFVCNLTPFLKFYLVESLIANRKCFFFSQCALKCENLLGQWSEIAFPLQNMYSFHLEFTQRFVFDFVIPFAPRPKPNNNIRPCKSLLRRCLFAYRNDYFVSGLRHIIPIILHCLEIFLCLIRFVKAKSTSISNSSSVIKAKNELFLIFTSGLHTGSCSSHPLVGEICVMDCTVCCVWCPLNSSSIYRLWHLLLFTSSPNY